MGVGLLRLWAGTNAGQASGACAVCVHTHTALSTRVQRHHLLNNGCMRPTALKHWRVIISQFDFVPGAFKLSVRMISLNPHNHPVREGPLLFPFYR